MFWLEYKFTAKERHDHPTLPDSWQPQGLHPGTATSAKQAATKLIACYGREWRITKYQEKEPGLLTTAETTEQKPGSPNWPGTNTPKPHTPEPPQVPAILERFTQATPGYSKEQQTYLALLAKDALLNALLTLGTPEERKAWNQQVYNSLINDVLPISEETGEETLKDMQDDIQAINVLRFFGFLTAAQTRQLLRNTLTLGDSALALLALKLDDEASGDETLEIAQAVVANNPKVAEDFKNGKIAAANSLIGQVIRKGKELGRPVDPNSAKELILKVLQGQ